MLTAYRRHLDGCKSTTRDEKKCQCPVWVQGTAHGVSIRKSLSVRSWEAGQKLIRDIEVGTQVSTETVKSAGEKFLADCAARQLGPAQMGKYKLLVEELTERFGDQRVGSLTVDDLRAYRESWTLSPITSSKKLERLRTFFKFCNESGWASGNPAKVIKAPKVKQKPTLPFSDTEVEKLLTAVAEYPDRPHGRREQVRAFLLVLRYSGLRIGDVIKMRRADFSDGKILLYTQKTGQPVWLPLPSHVTNALSELPGSAYFFWSGNGKLKSAVADWQRSLAKLCKLAGIGGHAHRFRDTFAVGLLSAGVTLEDVSVLLGHSSIRITEKHYAPWVKSRQNSLEAAVSKAWKIAS